jgi:hypothetical protein
MNPDGLKFANSVGVQLNLSQRTFCAKPIRTAFDASKSSHSHRALARCQTRHYSRNRFNGFPRFAKKTVETVLNNLECFSTGLKPGVNELTFEGKPIRTNMKPGQARRLRSQE